VSVIPVNLGLEIFAFTVVVLTGFCCGRAPDEPALEVVASRFFDRMSVSICSWTLSSMLGSV
jgi:hypothetical protein